MRLVPDTAVNSCADALVTFNERDFAKVAKRFGIDVMLPGEALTKVRRERNEKE